MGRLVGLELSNFKSYKGTVKIGFGDSNFTSIIGPNGSGKSNMMDAISFVLGVRSNDLRSSGMKDLIHRSVRDSQSSNDDPTSAYVKAFYKVTDASEITELMRIVNLSGETIYKINGKTTSFKNYSDWLAKENILIKAKNFLVFQGDVETIASQSSLELTKLFEQVSGSIQYKKEYDLLKEDLNKINRLTNDAIKNRRRINGELKIYKEGIKKNNQYNEQINNIIQLKKFFVLLQLYHLSNEKSTFEKNLKKILVDFDELNDTNKEFQSNLSNLKKIFIKEDLLIIKQNSLIDQKLKNLNQLNNKFLPIKISSKNLNKKIKNSNKILENLDLDITRQLDSIKLLEKNLSTIKLTYDNFKLEINQSNEKNSTYQFKDSNDELEYSNLNAKYLNNGGFELEEKLNLLINEKNEIIDQKLIVEKLINNSNEKILNEFNINIDSLNLKIEDLNSNLTEKNSTVKAKIKSLKSLQSIIESSNNKEYDLNFKLRDTLLKLDNINATKRESNKEKKLRENVLTLKRIFPGVRGLVHDLCHPKKDKYALAILTILGKNFNSVIVDSLSVAQECISYLKKQRAGIISFIPLDTIEAQIPSLPTIIQNNPKYNNDSNCILTINAIEYEPEFERAMQYICSNSIICDNLDIAKDLKWNQNVKNVKFVTLDGSIIHKSNLMTGGASKNSMQSNNRWDKDEYSSLMTLKDNLILEIETISKENKLASINSRELETEISLLNSEITNLKTQLTQLTRNLKDNNTELLYHQNLIKLDYDPKLKDLNHKIIDIDSKMKIIEDERESLENETFKDFELKIGFSIKDYKKYSVNIITEQSKDLQKLAKDILNIENKLQFEKERLESTQLRKEKTLANIEKYNQELNDLTEQENQLNIQKENDSKLIEKEKTELKEIEKNIQNKKIEINEKEEVIKQNQNELNSIQKKIDALNENISKIDLERIGILKNCKISNIEIPITSAVNLNNLPIDKIDDDAILISNDIKVSFNELSKKYKKKQDYEKNLEDISNEIKETEDILLELQPNAKAHDRLDEAKDKFEVIDNETETLKTEEKEILTKFLNIKKKRKELFESCFDFVNEHIEPIYKELTKDPNSTTELGGGQATLTLEDEDEPFNGGVKYHATPPLKRFKDMEYLSGGEKTVAALALLFAINSYQPSPFFVLDEVDAALDHTNVERIAAYIRKHGNKDLQFIIISLKNTMFEKSDALVGVFRQQTENSSKALTLDLNKYAD
ncbi:hypothetical protein TBLA_0G03530 [Henningerozyma blattae CBS 6284]|uniref:Structural maintenance of chromosomes protein n=1 Tax=Henningerozyma blattae (strain ATCC 34711 / CBS 6284 / DSM 70876 / NBRC 10599 / NRRL Y-10934 / UCD 77-7) TaxID=1071380 RepID=I2H7D7_HENB6|nr:hypothetical protein TBLA_0G03530 [Tetrapisispora blattae CBS 6284]CCH62289.1 hypothetical protein TBLA_0G03530 [Tetrapisispora blattae CBS 6284]